MHQRFRPNLSSLYNLVGCQLKILMLSMGQPHHSVSLADQDYHSPLLPLTSKVALLLPS